MKQIPFISSQGEKEIPPLYYVDSCNSTQDLVLDLVNKQVNSPHTLACFTFNQLNGRGQGNNTWNDFPNQTIAYSIAVPLPDSIDLVLLNKLLTLNILHALQSFSTQNIQIKWPNDLICLNKKLSGLLIQIVSNKSGNRFVILGIGINVNQEKIQEILPHAISFREINQEYMDLGSLAKHIHISLSSDIYNLKNRLVNSSKEITEEFSIKNWGTGSCILIDIVDESAKMEVFNSVLGDSNSVWIQDGLLRIKVKIKGVDNFGRLQFEFNGSEFAYHHGQVKISYNQ